MPPPQFVEKLICRGRPPGRPAGKCCEFAESLQKMQGSGAGTSRTPSPTITNADFFDSLGRGYASALLKTGHKNPPDLCPGVKIMDLPLLHPVGGAGFELFQHGNQGFSLRPGEILGDEGLPAAEDPGDLRHGGQGFFRGKDLDCPFVLRRGTALQESVLLQNHKLPGHIALIDKNAPGELILGDAGAGADGVQIAGMAGFEVQRNQFLLAVESGAAGDVSDMVHQIWHSVHPFRRWKLSYYTTKSPTL